MTLFYLSHDLILNREEIESAHIAADKTQIRMKSGVVWDLTGDVRGTLAALTPNSPELEKLRRKVAQLRLDNARLRREIGDARTLKKGRGSDYGRGYNAGYQAARRGLANKYPAAGEPEETAAADTGEEPQP